MKLAVGIWLKGNSNIINMVIIIPLEMYRTQLIVYFLHPLSHTIKESKLERFWFSLPGGLNKTHISGPHPQSVRFTRSGIKPDNWHF